MRFLLFLLSISLLSCGKDEPEEIFEPVLESVSNLKAKDVANFGDARDIKISFTKPSNTELIEEFRLFILSESAEFDSLKAINEMNYVTVSLTSGNTISFKQEQKDIDGNPITENVAYDFYILSKATNESGFGGALSQKTSLTLQKKNVVRTITGSLNEGTGGMDTDAEGNIYVADFGNATNNANGTNVIKITPSGDISNFASGFAGASGNDFDNQGNLYQSNIAGNIVSKVTPDGVVSTFATGLRAPVGIAFDGNSSFYVCNCGDNSIIKLDMDGNASLFSSGSLFNCPNGIDIDTNGNIYVANFNNNTIVKITPSGTPSSFATMPGNNNGHLLIRDEFIYVVSRGLHQIHKVSFSGNVSLLAGSGKRGIVDGSLTEAEFSLPNDIAFSPDGKRLYVNDVNGSNTNTAVISPSIIRVIELVE